MKFAFGGLDFLLLWFIPAVLLFFLLLRAKRASRLELLLRFLTITSVIIAILQPYTEKRTEYSRALLLLDVSDSMDDSSAEDLLRRVREFESRGLELDILPFAAAAGQGYFEDSEALPFRRIRERSSALNIGETNVEEALRSNALVSGINVLMLSDGNETRGNVRSALSDIRNRGLHIFPLLPADSRRSEEHTGIAQLSAPLIAPLNQSAEIRATLSNPSRLKEAGSLTVEHDGKTVLLANVELQPGAETVYTALSDPSKEGIREVTATFRPIDPAFPVSARTIYLSGEMREKVLLISGTPEDARFLQPVFSDQAYQLTALTESGAENLPELRDFAVVILNNAARSQLPDDGPETIERYVENGGALIMIGGERSFGLGDYRQTPVENALPVNLLPPQAKQKRLNIAVELVVDKSKSMAEENKVEFVKDAAREVVRNLKEDDLLGVTAFDTSPFVAVPLGPVGRIREMAADRISIIFPHGKTNLLPAMAQARKSLENAQAGRKHMIVLTDGDLPDSGPHYVELVRQMRFSGITLSTVLIGPEFDRLLRQMADVGGGAFYNTNDPQALPRIFLRDVKVRSGEETMKEQQEFEVRKGPGNIESTSLRAFPLIHGFVQTQPKEQANLELVVGSPGQTPFYPLLASWSYGKGRSLAFTSDANGRWSRGWIEWPKFREFWEELVTRVQPTLKERAENVKFDLRYGLEGASLMLDLTLITSAPGAQPSAELIFPDGKQRTVEFENTAKGRFRCEIQEPLPGKYELRGTAGEKKLTPVAFELSGDLFGEKKGRGFNRPLLETLAGTSGGRINPTFEEIKSSRGEKVERNELSVFFIILALILLALEIAWRETLQQRKLVRFRRKTPRTPRGLRPLLNQKPKL